MGNYTPKLGVMTSIMEDVVSDYDVRDMYERLYDMYIGVLIWM